jgi:hypothetical protein
MTRIVPRFVLVVAALALPPSAQAASLTRTFVSSAGNDTNPCTVAAPCATFAAAYAAVAPNGIVAALDPGKYGPLTITGPVTIVGNGWAAITVPAGGTGITINATSTDAINLNGLLIDGARAGSTGVKFFIGQSLTMDNCIVRNVTMDGLDFNSATTAQTLAVSNSYFIDNGGNGMTLNTGGSGAIAASIARTGFYGNAADGLLAVSATTSTRNLTVAVVDSVAANNGLLGFGAASDTSNSTTNVTLTNSLAAGNGTGVEAIGVNATLWLAQSTVTGNGHGFNANSSGVIETFQDNYFANNGANTGSLTPVSQQ